MRDADFDALFTLARWTAFGDVLLERLGNSGARDRWRELAERHALRLIESIQRGAPKEERLPLPFSRMLLGALDPSFAEEES